MRPLIEKGAPRKFVNLVESLTTYLEKEFSNVESLILRYIAPPPSDGSLHCAATEIEDEQILLLSAFTLFVLAGYDRDGE